MNEVNMLAAKSMAKVLSGGMSLSGVDMAALVKSDAIDAICEISEALSRDASDKDKLASVQEVLERYMVT